MSKVITRTRKQVFELWIAALLSGKYKQTTDALKAVTFDDDENETGVGFCCVGVLCDLALQDRGGEWDDDCFTFRTEEVTEELGIDALEFERTEMPIPMRQFMGIREEEANYLYKLNDEKRQSFKQIADHIRTNLMPVALRRPMPFKG